VAKYSRRGVLAWNNDADVLYFAEGDDITGRTLEEVQSLYRGVSRTALLFIIEAAGRPIGECWVQEMNMERLRSQYSGRDLRRIDIMIGDKACWGHGWGTRAIRLLTDLAFDQGADAVFGVDISANNPRSQRAFAKVGYCILNTVMVPQPAKAQQTSDFVLWRREWVTGS
jgi:RimJ/RimL family protein N-acetyltransferase